jgi:hypothetical protein
MANYIILNLKFKREEKHVKRTKNISRVVSIFASCILCISMSAISAFAEDGQSLDDVLGNNSQSVVQEDNEVNADNNVDADANVGADNSGSLGGGDRSAANQQYINDLADATKLDEPSEGASKVNAGIKKVASLIVQILSYAITAFLVVRIMLDLAYVALPFARGLLGGGAAGAGAGMQGGMNNGMSGGMGGMSGGMYGGMNRGMGMGGMNGMQGGMAGQQGGPSIQLVSKAAIMAVETPNPYKAYAKEMMIVLILTPVFLVLAISGALSDLGFMLGGAITSIISNIGGMI